MPDFDLPGSTGVQCRFFLEHVKSHGLKEPCKFGVRCRNVHTYFPNNVFGVNLVPVLKQKHSQFVKKGILSELDKITNSKKISEKQNMILDDDFAKFTSESSPVS